MARFLYKFVSLRGVGIYGGVRVFLGICIDCFILLGF